MEDFGVSDTKYRRSFKPSIWGLVHGWFLLSVVFLFFCFWLFRVADTQWGVFAAFLFSLVLFFSHFPPPSLPLC